MNIPSVAILFLSLIAGGAFSLTGCSSGEKEGLKPKASVKLGVDVFLEKHVDLVKGKRVGLITNPSGVDGSLESTIERFFGTPGIQLAALYGPEHGVRGNAQAGEGVPFVFDERYRIPAFSLYAQSGKPPADMFNNIDAYMRSFDTVAAGKILEKTMVHGVDVLVYDIQDVGTRVYTYIATMAYALQTCAESGIKMIVLDRPNPINGVDIEGPVLDYPAFSSFVGLYPIPERHGMTVGELARLFNDRFLPRKADLTVIPMEGWTRDMWFDQTGLRWIYPSPNMPTLDTAIVYPGQVFIEGTNVSEGRGTTRPFELFGAPWIDGRALADKLNALGLPGVIFREAWFKPTFSKFKDELCGGAEIHVTDRNAYKAVETSLHILHTLGSVYPGKFSFHAEYFDKVLGTSSVREALERGDDIGPIVRNFEEKLKLFFELRKPYLLYD